MVTKILRFASMVALLGSVGCASTVAVRGAEGEVLVSFTSGLGRKVLVNAISVYEITDGLPRPVCEVRIRSMGPGAELTSWFYGSEPAVYETKCEQLVRNKKYAVSVFAVDHDTAGTNFMLGPDGKVVDTGLK